MAPPQQPPGHLRDAIQELRRFCKRRCSLPTHKRRVGVGEALFSETVCKAINLKTPVPYVPKGEGRFARTKGFENERSLSPYKQYEPEQRHASPVNPLPRRDLLLDDADQKELEELESQTLEDKKLLQHFEDRARNVQRKKGEAFLRLRSIKTRPVFGRRSCCCSGSMQRRKGRRTW